MLNYYCPKYREENNLIISLKKEKPNNEQRIDKRINYYEVEAIVNMKIKLENGHGRR